MPRSRAAFRRVPASRPVPFSPPTALPAEEIIRLFSELRTCIERLEQTVQSNHEEALEKIQEVEECVDQIPNHEKLINTNHKEALSHIGVLFDKLDEIGIKQGDPGKDGDSPDIEEIVLQVLARIRKPQDGKDADTRAIMQEVLKKIPKPVDEQKMARRIFAALKKLQPKTIVELRKEIKESEPGITKSELDARIAEIRNHVATSRALHGGGDTVVAGTGVTITDTVDGNKRISASGGVGAWSTPPEAPVEDGSVLIFTVGSSAPTDVVRDGISVYPTVNYTFAAGQITFTDGNGPTQYIRYR